ncbi:N-terminal nucleophile aminohydrolases superfamily protein, partial [Prunus dulcis]
MSDFCRKLAESPLYFDQSQNFTCKQSQIFPPNCQKRINQNLPDSNFPINSISEQFSKVHGFSEKFLQLYLTLKRGGLGRHAVHPSRKLAKSGDYDQPVPPADSSVTPSQLESLWQDAGDRSQPDPQSWQVSGTQSQPSRNPGRSRDT